jgi:hypothetical protein
MDRMYDPFGDNSPMSITSPGCIWQGKITGNPVIFFDEKDWGSSVLMRSVKIG